jgi:hypothetical protein
MGGFMVLFSSRALQAQTFTVTPIPAAFHEISELSDTGAVLGRQSIPTTERFYWHADTGRIVLPTTEADGSPIEIFRMNRQGQVLGNVRRLGGEGSEVFCDGICGPPHSYPIYFDSGFVWSPGQSFPAEPAVTSQSYAPGKGVSGPPPSYAADDLSRLIVYEQTIRQHSELDGSYYSYVHQTLKFSNGAPLTGPFGIEETAAPVFRAKGYLDFNGTQVLWDDEDGQVVWQEGIGGGFVDVTALILSQIPGASDVRAGGLLRDGRVAGSYSLGGNSTPFVWNSDGTIEVMPDGAHPTVNDLGWVFNGDALFIDGQPFAIDDHLDASAAGWSVSNIRFLNGPGQMLASAHFEGGPLQAILLTPLLFRWTNAVGGDWDLGDNWSEGQAPGENDRAGFVLPGSYNVALVGNVANEMMQVGAALAAEVANPRLRLNGFTYQAEVIAVHPHGHLEIDGAAGLVRANTVRVAAGGKLSGNGRMQPATADTDLNVTIDGEITMGPAGAATPVRQRFVTTGGGPEPAEFFAHLAVRGHYTQHSSATMNVVLTPTKAVNEGAIAANNSAMPPRSAELMVTGDAILDGRLRVTTAADYIPQHGEKFVIVDGTVYDTNFSEYDVPTAFNDLPLKPISTGSQVRLVTPQKIVLAWGEDLPVGLEGYPIMGHRLNRISPFDSEDAFASDNAAAFAEYQNNLLEHVRAQFSSSFVDGIEIVAGDPEPGAINVYFLERFPEFGGLLGVAYTGIDRFNTDPEGGAAIIVKGFRGDDPNDFEIDAETVTHEVGHLLGLRHVDPPGDVSVMDYGSSAGDLEVFQDGEFNITEPPTAEGTVFPHTHNPTYYLERYIDGASHEELEAQGIMPGTWDLPGAIGGELNINFTLRTGGEGDPSATLFDVLVFASPSNGIIDVLAEIDQLTLNQLAGMTFELNGAEGIGLLAKSAADGEYDIALAPGNPFESEALILYPGLGQLEGFLQIASTLPTGYETLAEFMLTVPEVIPGDFNADGTVDAADYVVWRKTESTPEEYDTWRANFGRSAGSAGSITDAPVPEPGGIILFAISLCAMAALGLPRERSAAAARIRIGAVYASSPLRIWT